MHDLHPVLAFLHTDWAISARSQREGISAEVPYLCDKHGRPAILPVLSAPAAVSAARRHDVAAPGLPLQRLPGRGRHSQNYSALQR